jgi:two-component system, OmpR family, copper resistance phosphate regulon response regulator CusR
VHILVIVDEKRMENLIVRGLVEDKFTVSTVSTGRNKLEFDTSMEYDMVILDSTLSGWDPWEVLRRLHDKMRRTSVLLLTVQSDVDDPTKRSRFGAADYLTKPFSLADLLARVDTILRRGMDRPPDIVRIGDLEIDFPGYRVMRTGRRVELTPKEFAILALLARRHGEVLSRTRIAERIWDTGLNSETNVVDVHMHRLRSKVDNSSGKKLIHTVRGIGYVLEQR